ncbi:MAG: GntR family transcriptional regulator [Prolixibacteraceae bacterium]|jgi:DNA-binding transcriptional regulator YhcF (GntR family)|nr:GntR family transcriptional regulator [Prolixibacteraceae bacterium]
MTINLNINPNSHSLKYIQLVDAVANAISEGTLTEGDMLPSVNDLMKNASLSRVTVFKAYSELKSRNIIESVPNRGYFVTKQLNRVLLFLDTFKAYKEVLYDGFRSNLPENISVDLMFHHYNIDVLETIINDSIGKYSHYIVMNFDHPRMKKIISKIPVEKLLLIDWNIHTAKNNSFVCQDFGKAVYDNFAAQIDKIRNYKRFVFIYPEKWTYHPKTTLENFELFCSDFKIKHEVLYNVDELNIQKGDLYFLVSDRTLTKILDQAEDRKLEKGKDIGIISYNDTPMKKYVKDGITVLSTNFTEMGRKAAEYVLNPGEMKCVIPTKLINRNSF